MDSDGLPIVGPGIDYSRVPAIQQKRTVAFLNHFVRHTAHFLNRFSCVCEQKLQDACVRIQRLETALAILEAKLSSIPGLENVQASDTGGASAASPAAPTSAPEAASGATPAPAAPPQPEPAEEEPAAPPEPEVVKVKDDPRYAKYFKMVQMGVPSGALRGKMAMEGLDADYLETPDAPAPAGAPAPAPAPPPASESDSDALSDDSDFSD